MYVLGHLNYSVRYSPNRQYEEYLFIVRCVIDTDGNDMLLEFIGTGNLLTYRLCF